MAFLIETELKGYEYRGYEEGVSQKSGKTWLTLKFEDSNARQIEVSVPHDMQRDPKVANLRRGDLCDVVVRAVAGRVQVGLVRADVDIGCLHCYPLFFPSLTASPSM